VFVGVTEEKILTSSLGSSNELFLTLHICTLFLHANMLENKSFFVNKISVLMGL